MPSYAGCVYSKPPKRYGAQNVDDLSAHALSKMNLVGLPLRESHQNERDLGKVTDQWQGPDGSLYVAFDIPDGMDTQVQREGLENGFYGYLSLSHQVGNPPTPIGGCFLKFGDFVNFLMVSPVYRRGLHLSQRPAKGLCDKSLHERRQL